MDPCCICLKNFPEEVKMEEKIKFNCGHQICLECSPYQILQTLKNSPFNPFSFLPSNQKSICLICEKGETQIEINQNNILKDQKPETLCNNHQNCKNNAVIFCVECAANYCSNCSDQVHNIKALSSHIKEPISNICMFCLCGKKKKIEEYCLQCACGICAFCSDSTHKSHKRKPIDEFLANFKGVQDLDENKQIISNIIHSFHEFGAKFTDCLEEGLKKKYAFIEQNIDLIIVELKSIKARVYNETKEILEKNEKQLLLVSSAFEFLKNELEKEVKVDGMNKAFHLNRLLEFWKFTPFKAKYSSLNSSFDQSFWSEITQKILSYKKENTEKIQNSLKDLGEFTFAIEKLKVEEMSAYEVKNFIN